MLKVVPVERAVSGPVGRNGRAQARCRLQERVAKNYLIRSNGPSHGDDFSLGPAKA